MAGLVAFIVWPGEREPEYQGKKLSEWLEISVEPVIEGEDEAIKRQQVDRASDAIRHIGTNALPCLMRWAFYEPSAWKKKSLGLLEKTTYGSRIKHRIYPGRPEELRNFSLEGFTILGKEATSVIPEMVRIMNAGRPEPDWPMLVLSCLADYGLPSLMEVITNRANTVAFRACALKYVRWDCTNSAWAVAPLAKCLDEQDWEIVSGAAHALGQLRKSDPSAAPVIGIFTDSDINVRRDATNALRKIAP